MIEEIKVDFRKLKKCYFPASKFKRAWQNAVAFFAPDELEALDYTINEIEYQIGQMNQKLSILRLERARKMQEIK